MALTVDPDRARAGERRVGPRRSRLPWAIAWSALMIAASSVPKIPTAPPPFLHYDKVLHLIEYGLFAWLWGDALRDRGGFLRRHAWTILVVGGILWGTLDEIYQGTVGRSRDPYDLLADTAVIVAVQAIQEKRARARAPKAV